MTYNKLRIRNYAVSTRIGHAQALMTYIILEIGYNMVRMKIAYMSKLTTYIKLLEIKHMLA
jgi:hypothetical protein